MKKILSLTAVLLMITAFGFAQSDNFWNSNAESRSNIATDKAVGRISYPKDFRLFNLNTPAFRQQLFSIIGLNSGKRSTTISLPNADGNLEQFEVVEASNFEPDLQARFPDIRGFSGKGISDKNATLKLSISPVGIQTMVFRTENDNEFIEPYSSDHTVYSVYRAHREKGNLPWTCTTEEKTLSADLTPGLLNVASIGGSTGQLKTMRLAQSCNGEYANYFGATSASQVGLVLAAFNNTLTRCNGVYEKDLALHLNLISNTTSVIFYSPSTDPYTTLSSWNLQLQKTLTATIGSANYDIGHMFGASGGGGNAGCIGCVCVDPASSNSLAKGSGITSPADGIPTGDNFDIDYVVHEVGHQLGANHTFSMSLEGTGQNKEVGSGITIMGYAGITSQDVAPHSIDIYHETSIGQIQANLASKICPVTTNISANNAPPVIGAVSNYTIPISTPFALTASASDANGDALTYCWEQNDNSTASGTASVASPTKASGPNWLSFRPTTDPTRLFPRLSTILSGGLVTGPLPGGDAGANIEALSSVSRVLNFRLTVRDNHPFSSVTPIAVGQTAFTDVAVTVTNTSGPFKVNAPNAAGTIPAGAYTVTWSVNKTDLAPVSCANVKISLSTDGGNTFSTVLAATTANDGSETVNIPSLSGSTNRIKVEAIGNIFFDISDANFTIGGTAPACVTPSGLSTSSITQTSATASWSAVSGATSYAVDFKAQSSSTWINLASATTALSANINGLTAATNYDWRLRTNCAGASSSYAQAAFTTANGTAPVTCPGEYDTNDNDNLTNAEVIPLNTDIKGQVAVKGDNDYYRFVSGGGSTTITLSTLPADYQLSLLNASNTVLASSTGSGTNAESITANLTGGATYYVRVYPRNNGAFSNTNCYTLNVAGVTGRGAIDEQLYVGPKLSVSPNPASAMVNLAFNVAERGNATVTVLSQTGSLVLSKVLAVSAGANKRSLDVSNLAPGMYVVKVQSGSGTQIGKLVIGK